jgi:hypothetical protein
VVTGGHSATAGLEADELAAAAGLPGIVPGAIASARAGADLG